MRSPVNWALLGLIIERESYAYELAKRFEAVYGRTLSLSSTSHVYTALTVLQERELVEQVPGTRAGRQPKPGYRATAEGVEGYGDWLVGYVLEDRRRQALFALGLSALASNISWVGEILRRCEMQWQEQGVDSEVLNLEGLPDGPGAELLSRILAEENKLTVGAKLSWAQYAREQLDEIIAAKATDKT
jgi:DNA-binding PadR family transcriptional regulator